MLLVTWEYRCRDDHLCIALPKQLIEGEQDPGAQVVSMLRDQYKMGEVSSL